jgi:hypothetical protein
MIGSRVFVTLPPESEGYPPVDEEALWAVEVESALFRLTSTPTFARGLSCGDVVHVVPFGNRWYADHIERSGGHSTLRVVLFVDAAHDRLLELGAVWGCSVDHTEIAGLFAIDVPPDRSYRGLREALAVGARDGLWDVDEGNLAFGHESD